MMIAPSLTMGGAERITATMANGFIALGHELTLALLVGAQTPQDFPLHPAVNVIHLDIFQAPQGPFDRLRNMFRRHRAIRRAIRQSKPDVLVSLTNIANIRTLLASVGFNVPVILAEHTDPRHYDIGPVWQCLRRWVYPHAAALVVLTEDMGQFFTRFVNPECVHVFFNPIEFPSQLPEVDRSQTILYLGRFSPEKNVPLLLEAFADCVQPGWKLALAGDGPDRVTLEAMCRQLGIADSVLFLGQIANVYPLLAGAAFCVLPSNFEGLPNALCEALVMGTPCLATATSGAKAVIRHGENGLLCPVGDVAAMRQAMEHLMNNPALRAQMGAKARELRSHITPEAVLAQWDALCRQVQK